ncbi:MAG: bifunctional tRNA (5-methylaminomethyl-2-thiouridine)(34)-methyltransferase MnmD/FAD-dependent 5-carboxymethylaminomethyl-2-thiouridine(34) oxidoreductase MnmC [Burkholderiales bacterium]|nr:bifunctional tRNA (5-methylaminomethyl-2-thiouridine)(34)-methyltransferase MnmD/FAD-dependent 5-carboxymethylaminomethyl-2-thiouridine(34) oxidoreductase MnmC [Burkholderiales bacterium]
MITAPPRDPPRLDWVDGQPVSRACGDVYFSRDGGLDQAREVFVAGNDLRARFAAMSPHARFHIAETGFGTGLAFLCAWQTFVGHAPATARLDFTSTEIAPLATDELAAALGLFPELARETQALLAAWSALPTGTHPFTFDGGRVRLMLWVGDARDTLVDARFVADAWFLDGFAPSADATLWDAATFAHVSRLSRVGTTCATWCVAGDVRRGLATAGFEVERLPGFGRKRERLRGICRQPAAAAPMLPWRRAPVPARAPRTAVVVGAGIAGATCAHALAQAGLAVRVLERAPRPATGASGHAVAALHIRPSAHATALTRLAVAGLATTWRSLRTQLPDDGVAWSSCGLLALATDADARTRAAALAAQAWPRAFLRAVDAAEASALAGLPLAHGGLFHAQAGWVHGPAWIAALLAHPAVQVEVACGVVRIDAAVDGGWCVALASGDTRQADVVVIANALDAATFAPAAAWPLAPLRGQVTHVVATPASAPLRTVLCGERYATPARAGTHVVGATFDARDAGGDVRAADHVRNVEALRALAPALHAALALDDRDAATLDGRAAVRCVTPDHLPMVGAVLDRAALHARYGGRPRTALERDSAPAPWHPGLFVSVAHGGRGFVTAALAADHVAALAVGAPTALPEPVAAAVDPNRFDARGLKQRRAVPAARDDEAR